MDKIRVLRTDFNGTYPTPTVLKMVEANKEIILTEEYYEVLAEGERLSYLNIKRPCGCDDVIIKINGYDVLIPNEGMEINIPVRISISSLKLNVDARGLEIVMLVNGNDEVYIAK